MRPVMVYRESIVTESQKSERLRQPDSGADPSLRLAVIWDAPPIAVQRAEIELLARMLGSDLAMVMDDEGERNFGSPMPLH